MYTQCCANGSWWGGLRSLLAEGIHLVPATSNIMSNDEAVATYQTALNMIFWRTSLCHASSSTVSRPVASDTCCMEVTNH